MALKAALSVFLPSKSFFCTTLYTYLELHWWKINLRIICVLGRKNMACIIFRVEANLGNQYKYFLLMMQDWYLPQINPYAPPWCFVTLENISLPCILFHIWRKFSWFRKEKLSRTRLTSWFRKSPSILSVFQVFLMAIKKIWQNF